MSDIYKKLMQIQFEIKVEKNKYNKFAEFNYRSCEDILQELKPLLKKYELAILLTDTVEQLNDRSYIKSTAILTDGTDEIKVNALAREPEKCKAKMDESQTTGSTTSYARKYALSGLLALDDGNDSDKLNNGKGEKPAEKLITQEQIEELRKLGFSDERLKAMAIYHKVDSIEKVTFKQAQDAISKKKRAEAKNGQS